MFKFAPVAVIALLTASTAPAAITIYTSSATFGAAISAPGTDSYNDLALASTPSPIARSTTSGASYSYTAAVSTTSFFNAGTPADVWLSTNTATDSIIFTGFTAGVRGVGGLFFGSDQSGSYQLGNITISATDASGTMSQTIIGATTNSFVGFVSTGALTNVTVTSIQPQTGFLWPTVNNLVLARAAVQTAVPEPSTWMMMISGFGLVGWSMRRRATRVLANA